MTKRSRGQRAAQYGHDDAESVYDHACDQAETGTGNLDEASDDAPSGASGPWATSRRYLWLFEKPFWEGKGVWCYFDSQLRER